MRSRIKFIYYYGISKIRQIETGNNKRRQYFQKRKAYVNKEVCSANEINDIISLLIKTGEPFMAGRFGATELSAVRTFDFEVSNKYSNAMAQMQKWSGFFPSTRELGIKFKDLMIECIPEVDILGVWLQPFEDYYLREYGKDDLKITYLFDLEPWSASIHPWSAALYGKKVLVIHPFIDTIKKQYLKRELLFPGTDILPEFELKTLKAVQTIAGEKDERFETWFDALDWMVKEALKIDFDIAIIGCGAYGFPLAVNLKRAGKQAIHLGGATQLLFGIKGKRWEEELKYAYVQKYFNESWVNPSLDETPKSSQQVEGGCYW